MGCLLTTSSKLRRPSTPTVTTVESFQSPIAETNGVIRVQKEENHTDDVQKPNVLRMRAPPPAPHQSPPTPRPLPTAGRTPEPMKTPLNVQFVEDLEPATNSLPDEIIVSTVDQNNFVSVSNVTMKPQTAHVRGQRNQSKSRSSVDTSLSIEDLDTEMDTYSRYSAEKSPSRDARKVSMPTTDILLPRRKPQPGLVLTPEPEKRKPVSKTPVENVIIIHKNPETKEKYDDDFLDFLPPLPVQPINNGNAKVFMERQANSNVVHENVTPFVLPPDINDTDNETVDGLDMSDVKNEEEFTNIVELDGEERKENIDLKSISAKSIHDLELDRERQSRKRKRERTKKSADRTLRSSKYSESSSVSDFNKTSLFTRPISGASTHTLNSTGSLESNATFESRPNTPYVHAGQTNTSSRTTPVSLGNDSLENTTELIDIEDDSGEFDIEAKFKRDTKQWEEINTRFGIKTDFNARTKLLFDNSNLKDLDMKMTPGSSGHSSSAVFTKQKLMYSRFARRRPNSETIFRIAGKPPLPPHTSSLTAKRPVSETVVRSQAVSRYFTEDMDIH